MLTQQKLEQLFTYDPNQGKLFWKEPTGPRVKKGQEAGTLNFSLKNKGAYRRVKINGVSYAIHHLIWLWETGDWPTKQIDHINGNPSDNRIVNLRDVDQQTNLRNSYRAYKGTHGINHKPYGYAIQFTIDGRNHYFGFRKTFKAAQKLAAEIKEQLSYEKAR